MLASTHPGAENFHEWRKQVGYLRDMVRLLKPMRPDDLAKFSARLKKLESCLSEDHDLAVLRQWFLAVVEKSWAADEAESLLSLISKRQAELQAKAKPLGARIYAEPPKAFADRLEKYWRAWRASTK
jgi:CHAD domain-containing protein